MPSLYWTGIIRGRPLAPLRRLDYPPGTEGMVPEPTVEGTCLTVPTLTPQGAVGDGGFIQAVVAVASSGSSGLGPDRKCRRRLNTDPLSTAVRVSRSPAHQPSALVTARSAIRPEASRRPIP